MEIIRYIFGTVLVCSIIFMIWASRIITERNEQKPDSTWYYSHNIDTLVIEEKKTIERINTINNYYEKKKTSIDSINPIYYIDSIRTALGHFNDQGEFKGFKSAY